ncbi:hypothetical protein SEPCBS57363_002144 [Sporothrix epigloea]|uniref:Yeast cell wall synthesis Kre9/Knh1-like N-terminal domain-containing protein n=1 Tax=Sporothrix epigloea TaxID=1892477 RepID=A0ABP0DFW4_9PEZI
MRFTAATLIAFASVVLAQTANFDVVSQPTKDAVVPAGETFTIVWSPSAKYNDDTVTLALLGGPTPQTLQEVSVIKTGLDSSAGKYNWAVASSLGADATYGIRITLDSDPSIMEYSFPFQIGSKSTGSTTSGSSSNSGSHLDNRFHHLQQADYFNDLHNIVNYFFCPDDLGNLKNIKDIKDPDNFDFYIIQEHGNRHKIDRLQDQYHRHANCHADWLVCFK